MARSPDYDDKRDEAIVPPALDRNGTITPVLEPNEARQGVTHLNMRYVLGLSLAGIVVVFAVVYIAFFGNAPAPPVGS